MGFVSRLIDFFIAVVVSLLVGVVLLATATFLGKVLFDAIADLCVVLG